MSGTAPLRSSEVARAAGVNQQTLRYYERRGLLARPDRSPGGHRRYDPGTVTVLRVIKAAQRLGFTLDEVADLLEVGHHPGSPAGKPGRRGRPGLQERARDKLQEVEARLEDLQVIRTTLLAALDAGCDDLVDCAGNECCPLPFADIASPSDDAPALDPLPLAATGACAPKSPGGPDRSGA